MVPPLLVIVPELEIIPELVIVTLDGIVTVIAAGTVTVSLTLIVVGGLAPPHVTGSFQFPLCTAVNVLACAS